MKHSFTSKIYCSAIATLVLVALAINPNAYSATSVATATLNVVQALSVENLSDLQFGSATPGSPAAQVNPNANRAAALFIVKGEPNAAFQITLPSDQEVALRTENSATSIPVTKFQSFPSGSGRINADGSQELRVGATRESIPSTASVAAYKAQFTVVVTY